MEQYRGVIFINTLPVRVRFQKIAERRVFGEQYPSDSHLPKRLIAINLYPNNLQVLL